LLDQQKPLTQRLQNHGAGFFWSLESSDETAAYPGAQMRHEVWACNEPKVGVPIRRGTSPKKSPFEFVLRELGLLSVNI
jgi:hypothetical protein